MVGAGFAASVAPLGTALTENQLALLWKMADEPILCFDGDKAGQKAAWRAADLALPHLKPGKSLRFALLPEGQDPDDLARSRRARCDRGSDRRGARARRHDLVARDRRRHVCDARAARGAGGADRRIDQRHPRRGGAALLSPGSGERLQRTFAPEISRGGYGKGNYRAGAGNFGGESGRRFAPRGSFTPGAAGRSRPAAGGKPRPAARPSTAGPTRRRARSWR